MPANGKGDTKPVSAAELLELAARQTKDVEIPELGGRTIRIRGLHEFDAAALRRDFKGLIGQDEETVDLGAVADLDTTNLDKWIGDCMLDPDTNERLFSVEEVESGVLRKLSGTVLVKVLEAIFELMGETQEAQEKIAGESDPSRDSASSSG